MTKLEKIVYDAVPFDGSFSEIVKTETAKAIAAAVSSPDRESIYDSGVLTGQVSEAHPKADKNFINDEKGQWLSENITKKTE